MTTVDPLVGTRLGPCQLEALIGRGGMGRVYRARHLALDRLVAVKLLDAGGPAARAMVLGEARAAAKLEDSRVVAIHEVGEDKGLPYIVMQWVEGETLETRVRRLGQLPCQEALTIIREVAAALRSAHAAGIVHRDVKPGNVMVDAKGQVKLTDFGIARQAGSKTQEAASGSFHFMAPEQALGAPPDPRSDLYALGSTWYYALTGKPPYPGSPMDALMRHREEPPPEVRDLRPDVTERAAALLLRLMAKNVEERPMDAETLIAEMSSSSMLLDTDVSGSPFRILPPPPPSATRPVPTQSVPSPAAPVAPTMAVPSAAPTPAAAPLPTASKIPGAMPPPPPAPSAAPATGSPAVFLGLLAAFGAIAFGWQWKRAVAEDWALAAGVLTALPAALTFGDRRSGARKALGALMWAASLACWTRFAPPAGVASAPLESMILFGLGAVAGGGAVYLGLWGTDDQEAWWARVLSPAAGLLLFVSALTWTLPETVSWLQGLGERAAAAKTSLAASGAAWRWLGSLAVLSGMAAARRLRTVSSEPQRLLNWNK